jgi:hypothetical protein
LSARHTAARLRRTPARSASRPAYSAKVASLCSATNPASTAAWPRTGVRPRAGGLGPRRPSSRAVLSQPETVRSLTRSDARPGPGWPHRARRLQEPARAGQSSRRVASVISPSGPTPHQPLRNAPAPRTSAQTALGFDAVSHNQVPEQECGTLADETCGRTAHASGATPTVGTRLLARGAAWSPPRAPGRRVSSVCI